MYVCMYVCMYIRAYKHTAMGLLQQGDPTCPLALASKMLNEAETFDGWTYNDFCVGARFLSKADVESPNAPIEASINLMMQCEQHLGHKSTGNHWVGNLLDSVDFSTAGDEDRERSG